MSDTIIFLKHRMHRKMQAYCLRIKIGSSYMNVLLKKYPPTANRFYCADREYALALEYLYEHHINNEHIIFNVTSQSSSKDLANIRIWGDNNFPVSKRTGYEQYILNKETSHRDTAIPKDSVKKGRLANIKRAYHYLRISNNNIDVVVCDKDDRNIEALKKFAKDCLSSHSVKPALSNNSLNDKIFNKTNTNNSSSSIYKKFLMACCANKENPQSIMDNMMIHYTKCTEANLLHKYANQIQKF